MRVGDMVQLHPALINTYTYNSNGSTGEKLNNTPGLTMILLELVNLYTVTRCKVLLPDGRITWISKEHLKVVKMRVGDIVKLMSVFSAPIPLYSTWGNKEGGGDKTNGNIHPNEIGIVLETTESRGGNGARIMVSGRIGWINLNFLENKT